MQRLLKGGRKHGNVIVPTIATRSQNNDLACFQQRLVVYRRVRHRPPWIVEVHALLSGCESLCLGSCGCPDRRPRDLARLSSKQDRSYVNARAGWFMIAKDAR